MKSAPDSRRRIFRVMALPTRMCLGGAVRLRKTDVADCRAESRTQFRRSRRFRRVLLSARRTPRRSIHAEKMTNRCRKADVSAQLHLTRVEKPFADRDA